MRHYFIHLLSSEILQLLNFFPYNYYELLLGYKVIPGALGIRYNYTFIIIVVVVVFYHYYYPHSGITFLALELTRRASFAPMSYMRAQKVGVNEGRRAT